MKLSLKELWHIIIIYIALLLLTTEFSDAKSLSKADRLALSNAAKTYNVSEEKLLRIAYVESHFNKRAVRINKNYTMDYGAFQINSIHWHTTCSEYNIFEFAGNVSCAAKLLSVHKKHKYKDTQWMARFHSKTPSKKQKYYNKLMEVPHYALK